VWIAPQQLAEEARHRVGTLGLTDYVELFEGARMPLAQLRATVGQWWDLAALAEGYDGFCATHEPVMRRWSRQRRPGDAAAFADYMRVVDSWRKIVYRDPRLPAELLPADWVGSRAERIFFGLHATLRGPAEKHVISVLESV
jgi:phenylacetic acid degradation operon negative regulatory protein